MLIMKIKQEIIVLSLENIVFQSIETLITVKLNHKIPVVVHVLKSYDCHLIMQEVSKFSLKSKRPTKWIKNICKLYYQW